MVSEPVDDALYLALSFVHLPRKFMHITLLSSASLYPGTLYCVTTCFVMLSSIVFCSATSAQPNHAGN